VERIDVASEHSQKEWRLQDGLVAGEHGQDHRGCGIRPTGMQLEVRSTTIIITIIIIITTIIIIIIIIIVIIIISSSSSTTTIIIQGSQQWHR
jgi:hypothetical protein